MDLEDFGGQIISHSKNFVFCDKTQFNESVNVQLAHYTQNKFY